MLRRIVDSLEPAILDHQAKFKRGAGQIKIISDTLAQEEASVEKPGIDIAEIRKVIRNQFKRLGSTELRRLGAKVQKSTLYTVSLGSENYHLLTIDSHVRASDLKGFTTWHKNIKQKFGVAVHLINTAQHEKPEDKKVSSLIKSGKNLAPDLRNLHASSSIKNVLGQSFFSIDNPKSMPEDTIAISKRLDGTSRLTICFPLRIAGYQALYPQSKVIAIGMEAHVGKKGEILSCGLQPLLTANRKMVSHHEMSNILNKHIGIVSGSTESRRRNLNQDLTNTKLDQELIDLSELAFKIRENRAAQGYVVENNVMRNIGSAARMLSSHEVVSDLMTLTQQLSTAWFLNNKDLPVIVRREMITFSRILPEINAVLPWVKQEDLHQNGKRMLISAALRAAKREDLIEDLAQAILKSKINSYEVVSSPQEMKVYDHTRLKASARNSVTALANQIQFCSHFFDTTPLTRGELQEIAMHQNSDKAGKEKLQRKILRIFDNASHEIRDKLLSDNFVRRISA